MKSLSLPSPAKVNLYLRVLRKRPDGFHDIDTIFERISLHDTITFSPVKAPVITIRCSHPDVPCGPGNLVYQAAEMLRNKHHVEEGVRIVIKKNIPVAAGLGGGSSNAATALLGLNRLWGLNLSLRQLVGYGKKIGSDVPFFLYNQSWARGLGRGTRIQPLTIKRKMHHVLVVPKVKLLTKNIYRDLHQKRNAELMYHIAGDKNRPIPLLSGRNTKVDMNLLTKKGDNASILIRNLQKNNLRQVSLLMENDLEISALSHCARLLNLKKRLKSLNVQGVMVSGSGPSVFGTCLDRKHADAVSKILKRKYSQVFSVSTL